MSLTNFQDIKDKGFPLSLRGYSTKEVDYFIREVLNYCEKLLEEKKEYQSKLMDYQEKDEYLKNALVKTERLAKEIILEAESEANKIIEDAKVKATSIISDAKTKKAEELNDIRIKKSRYDKLFSKYIQEGRAVLDAFFVLSRKHVDALKNEFINEVLNSMEGLDKEFKEIDTAPDKEEIAVKKNDFFAEGDGPFVGRVIKDDIKDENGQVFIPRGTVITPELVNEIIARGFYGELVAALGEEG